jgi:hypothetical protein
VCGQKWWLAKNKAFFISILIGLVLANGHALFFLIA